MGSQINEISVYDRAAHVHVSIPVPYCANTSEQQIVLRALVATQWMDVTDVFSVHIAERPHCFPPTMPVARLRVDNNGGEPFEADVDVSQAFMCVLSR